MTQPTKFLVGMAGMTLCAGVVVLAVWGMIAFVRWIVF